VGRVGGSPPAFHAVNVLAHAAVSLLVLALLLEIGTPSGALVGAVVFAIHPVHTEAVANVVGGRSCTPPPSTWPRACSTGAGGGG
jgi:hypothetical protein